MIAPEEGAGNCPAKFALGKLAATTAAYRALTREDIFAAVRRHQAGDWGDVTADDWIANEIALLEETRLFSVYRSAEGVVFWVITEADRSSTMVLLPEDY